MRPSRTRMIADSLKVHQLFELDRRYLVPPFQRSCVCERDRQRQPPSDNLQKVAECRLEARPVR
jgi:hypothetical protein